jgi:hypothetical protein
MIEILHQTSKEKFFAIFWQCSLQFWDQKFTHSKTTFWLQADKQERGSSCVSKYLCPSYKEGGQCKDKYKIERQVAVPPVLAGGRGVGCGMVWNLVSN